jgi:hypothetical protein
MLWNGALHEAVSTHSLGPDDPRVEVLLHGTGWVPVRTADLVAVRRGRTSPAASRRMVPPVSIRLSDTDMDLLESAAAAEGVKRGEIVVRAVQEYLHRPSGWRRLAFWRRHGSGA